MHINLIIILLNKIRRNKPGIAQPPGALEIPKNAFGFNSHPETAIGQTEGPITDLAISPPCEPGVLEKSFKLKFYMM